VYYGFASVHGGPVYKTVLSLGLNPTFNTKEETVVSQPEVASVCSSASHGSLLQEAYILNEFKDDFYDQEMALIICGYIRPSLQFTSFGERGTILAECSLTDCSRVRR
jgi:FAD synthase